MPGVAHNLREPSATNTHKREPVESWFLFIIWLGNMGWPREKMADWPWHYYPCWADSAAVYGMVWKVRTYLDESVCTVLDGIGLQS